MYNITYSRYGRCLLRLGRSPGVRNGNPLQYSCMENSMDRGWGHKESDVTK